VSRPDPRDGLPQDWDDDHAPDPAAIANATRLLAMIRAAGVVPELAQVGYWPTVCLEFDGGRTLVEVFNGSFEVYTLTRPGEDASLFTLTEHDAAAPDVLDQVLTAMRRSMASNPLRAGKDG